MRRLLGALVRGSGHAPEGLTYALEGDLESVGVARFNRSIYPDRCRIELHTLLDFTTQLYSPARVSAAVRAHRGVKTWSGS